MVSPVVSITIRLCSSAVFVFMGEVKCELFKKVTLTGSYDR